MGIEAFSQKPSTNLENFLILGKRKSLKWGQLIIRYRWKKGWKKPITKNQNNGILPSQSRVHVSAVALDLEAISMLCIIIWGMTNEACDTNWVLCVRYRHSEYKYTDICIRLWSHSFWLQYLRSCVWRSCSSLYRYIFFRIYIQYSIAIDSDQEMIVFNRIYKDLAGIC